jgi:hypothetical protein
VASPIPRTHCIPRTVHRDVIGPVTQRLQRKCPVPQLCPHLGCDIAVEMLPGGAPVSYRSFKIVASVLSQRPACGGRHTVTSRTQVSRLGILAFMPSPQGFPKHDTVPILRPAGDLSDLSLGRHMHLNSSSGKQDTWWRDASFQASVGADWHVPWASRWPLEARWEPVFRGLVPACEPAPREAKT